MELPFMSVKIRYHFFGPLCLNGLLATVSEINFLGLEARRSQLNAADVALFELNILMLGPGSTTIVVVTIDIFIVIMLRTIERVLYIW